MGKGPTHGDGRKLDLRSALCRTGSPLHINLHAANFQRWNVPSHAQSLKLFNVCTVASVRPLSVDGFCVPYSTACSMVVQCIYFKPRLSSEVTEEPKKIDDMGNEKWLFFIWGGTVSFWGMGPRCNMEHEACSNHSEFSPLLSCQLWWEKEALIVFPKG